MNGRLFQLRCKYNTHEELTDYLREKEKLSVEVKSFIDRNIILYKARIVSLKTLFILSEAINTDYHTAIDDVLNKYFDHYETKMGISS